MDHVNIGSSNDLLLIRRQAITLTNVDLLSIDLPHKRHSAPAPYPTMHGFVT